MKKFILNKTIPSSYYHSLNTIIPISFYILLLLISGYSIMVSPLLVNNHGQIISKTEIERVEKIGNIRLSKDFFVKIPEFLSYEREANWWEEHRQVYSEVANQNVVNIVMPVTIKCAVMYPEFSYLFKHYGMLYLVSFLLLVVAMYLIYFFQDASSYLLSVGIYSASVYYLSAGTVSLNSITFSPELLNFLIWTSYVSSAGFIAFVHFSFIFPKSKLRGLLKLALLICLYSYTILVILLYFTNVIAYGASLPLVIFWTLLMSASFIHSYITETDKEFKKPLLLIILMPIFGGCIFTFANVLANSFNISPTPITQQALFTLIVAIALALSYIQFSIIKTRLYQQRKQLVTRQILPEYLEMLTKKETIIVQKIMNGDTSHEIASQLNTAKSTVDKHISNIFIKINVNSQLKLIAKVTGISAIL